MATSLAAGYINASYTGAYGTGSDPLLIRGGNLPPASIADNEGFYFVYRVNGSSSYTNYLPTAHYLCLVRVIDYYYAFAGNSGISAVDSQRLDEKLDDGFPFTGKVQTDNYPVCATSTAYKSSASEVCRLSYYVYE